MRFSIQCIVVQFSQDLVEGSGDFGQYIAIITIFDVHFCFSWLLWADVTAGYAKIWIARKLSYTCHIVPGFEICLPIS